MSAEDSFSNSASVISDGKSSSNKLTERGYKMMPVTETAFILEGLEDVHFEFVLKDGKAIEIVGVYADGSREPSKRTS